MDADFLSLRFTGNGVFPGNTRCKEVAALISATEDLVEAVASENDDDDEEDQSGPPLCLIAIEDKSLGFKFSKAHMLVALLSWQSIASVINTGRFDRMSVKAKTSLEEIVRFVKKRQCDVELRDSRHPEPMATITPEMVLPDNLRMPGETSMIGTVVRVGGNEPKVGLKLANGKTLSCETTEAIAKELGHRLYDVVTCEGEAVWDMETGTVLKFRITEVGTFIEGSVSEAFSEIAKAMPSTIEKWRSKGLAQLISEDTDS
ncbi:MAG TPA: hypothetical protein PLB55_06600 [Prosthecobacter sp.]|nr:hypothetical protein [Prosthecobacter sp.]